jgi:hypothetical protein
MNPETRPLFLRCTADGKRFLMTTNSEAGEGESAPVTVALNWVAGLKNQARRHSERPTYNSPPGHFLVKLRRSRRQVSARRKLHRAVDAQVATANSIPWSSTAKFSRNGVLVAPLRVSYGLLGASSRPVATGRPETARDSSWEKPFMEGDLSAHQAEQEPRRMIMRVNARLSGQADGGPRLNAYCAIPQERR